MRANSRKKMTQPATLVVHCTPEILGELLPFCFSHTSFCGPFRLPVEVGGWGWAVAASLSIFQLPHPLPLSSPFSFTWLSALPVAASPEGRSQKAEGGRLFHYLAGRSHSLKRFPLLCGFPADRVQEKRENSTTTNPKCQQPAGVIW